ncbi:MAG: plastocyanin/azurin family copper-binding protein [Chloroflexi bacterium]|nr:plastocyanin/azurin family copper-binding protein [Chloroflexota bacterium]MCZ6891576.1 plastocyanin/azurin family copper-binding protein [Chloroflexota bacterium]
MRKKVLSPLGLILSVAMLAAACGGGDDDEPTPRPTIAPTETAAPTQPSGNGTPAGEVVTVVQTENPYVFQPDAYNFELGTTYTLAFEAPGEFHTFTVDELGINIFVNANESVRQDITPSTAGSFKLYCVPHESLGMVGTVTVS